MYDVSEEIYELIKYAIYKPDGRSRSKIEQIVKYAEYERLDLVHECYLDWVDKPYEAEILTVRKEVYKKLKRMLYHLQKRLDTEMFNEEMTLDKDANGDVETAEDYFTTIELLVLKDKVSRQQAADLLGITYNAFQLRLSKKLKAFKEIRPDL
jgi:hypothetical protein